MSILSCEKFFGLGNQNVIITRRKNAIDIDFEDAPQPKDVYIKTSGNDSGSIWTSGSVFMSDGTNYASTVNSVYNTPSGAPRVLGFRLFFYKGNLKCVRKDQAYTVSWPNNNGNQSYYTTVVANVKSKHHFCYPAVSAENLAYGSREAFNHLYQVILKFSSDTGIKIPDKFTDSNFPGIYLDGSRKFMSSILDWLSFPIVREIDDPIMARQLGSNCRNKIAPKFESKNFKQLVDFYFGRSTDKMLQEIWKVITKADPQRPGNGNKLNPLVFTLGVALYRVLGFDYFYQSLGHIQSYDSSESARHTSHSSKTADRYTVDIGLLYRHLTPTKLINLISAEDFHDQSHDWDDALRMLQEYEKPDSIPKGLKGAYPNGLTVDFKFKTLKEFHDKISTRYTIIKTEANKKPISVDPIYAYLHGRGRKGLRLIVPFDTAILAEWGQKLSICIASYGDRAARSDTLLLGVEKDNEIAYCIEFNSFRYNCIKASLPMGPLMKPYDTGSPDIVSHEEITACLPRLEHKHVGVAPPDVSEEDQHYYLPRTIQFRAHRNGSPTVEDRNVVENMLIEWSKENISYLEKFEEIFKDNVSQYIYGGVVVGDYAQQQQAVYHGQPDQMLIDPVTYQALANQLGQQMQHQVHNQMIQAFGMPVNAANPLLIYLDRDGNLPEVPAPPM